MDRIEKGKSLVDSINTYVLFDIETTGLDPRYDEIIEIGAIKVIDDKIVDKFSELIKPNHKINEFITELTGITNEMLEDAKSISYVLPQFKEFIKDNILIGHNVNFDINFVYDNLIKNNYDALKNDFIDTMRIGRKLLPELEHHRLIDIADYFNINSSNNHRALRDCEITFNVYNKLKELAVSKNLILSECFKRSKSIILKDIVPTTTTFDEDNMFYNKQVVITGKLEKMIRKDAFQIIVNLGGIIENSVSSKTNFLILGNNDYNPILKGKKSSKQIKAEKLLLKGNDIQIISENVFYDIINDSILSEKVNS